MILCKHLKSLYGIIFRDYLLSLYPANRIYTTEYPSEFNIGDLCFKDIESGHNPEIGYGILEEYREEGFATAAVKPALKWAFQDPRVKAVEAETDPDNVASQKVLMKCGFRPNGEIGEEGPRYQIDNVQINT